MAGGSSPIDEGADTGDESGFLAVPLFPLPNVVLFPKSVLPLHIFEDRYKVMTADALEGGRRIAMALLRPGWEKGYQSRPPIEPIVCVGKVLTHELLDDGRYNFLLQGMIRARLVRELPPAVDYSTEVKPYRVGILRPLDEHVSQPSAVDAARDALRTIFSRSALGQTPLGEKFLELMDSPLPTADLGDLIAFNFLDDVPLKQNLLAEEDVSRRLTVLVHALAKLSSPAVLARARIFGGPSMN